MKLAWVGATAILLVMAILLVITACGTAAYSESQQLPAIPTQSLAVSDLTKSEVNGLTPLREREPSALCRDGSYSYSEHRRGTCSWHGGVQQWLKPIPP